MRLRPLGLIAGSLHWPQDAIINGAPQPLILPAADIRTPSLDHPFHDEIVFRPLVARLLIAELAHPCTELSCTPAVAARLADGFLPYPPLPERHQS